MKFVESDKYRENLFIDGFIRACAAREVDDSGAYIRGLSMKTLEDCVTLFASLGMEVVELRTLGGAVEDDDNESQVTAKEILLERYRIRTLREGDVQAQAEAEALQILRLFREGRATHDDRPRRAFFLSTSRLLDKMYQHKDGLLTWFPETLYKHIQYVSAAPLDPEAMFEAIASSFYSIGVNIIDEDRYRGCFARSISEANAVFDRERERYVQSLESAVGREQVELSRLERSYASTADLEKPHFVSMMGWITARTAEQRAKRAEEGKRAAEERARNEVAAVKEEYERKLRDLRRHEEGRARNLRDPKHQAKRSRQAKKRKRKE